MQFFSWRSIPADALQAHFRVFLYSKRNQEYIPSLANACSKRKMWVLVKGKGAKCIGQGIVRLFGVFMQNKTFLRWISHNVLF